MGPRKSSQKSKIVSLTAVTPDTAMTVENFITPFIHEKKSYLVDVACTRLYECVKTQPANPVIIQNCLAPFIHGVNAKVHGRFVLFTRWKGANSNSSINFNGVLFEYNEFGFLVLASTQPRAILPASMLLSEKEAANLYTAYPAFDGTGVTLYYNNVEKDWRLMTSTSIIADANKYFGKKTLREAFDETMAGESGVNTQALYDELCKKKCYSFTLSHPDWNPCVQQRALYPVQTTSLVTGKVTNDTVFESPKPISFDKINFRDIREKPIATTAAITQVGVCLRAKPEFGNLPDYIIATPYYLQVREMFYSDACRDLYITTIRGYLRYGQDSKSAFSLRFPEFIAGFNQVINLVTEGVTNTFKNQPTPAIPELYTVKISTIIELIVKSLATKLDWKPDFAAGGIPSREISRQLILGTIPLDERALYWLCVLVSEENLGLV